MDYKETVELEKNIKIKNKAQEIVKGFVNNVTLNLATKKGNRFTLWQDNHNATYVRIEPENITFIGSFLNNKYSIVINESTIFSGIKNNDRNIEEVALYANVSYEQHDYK